MSPPCTCMMPSSSNFHLAGRLFLSLSLSLYTQPSRFLPPNRTTASLGAGTLLTCSVSPLSRIFRSFRSPYWALAAPAAASSARQTRGGGARMGRDSAKGGRFGGGGGCWRGGGSARAARRPAAYG